MSLWAIAIKSVRQRALASALTSLSVALGVMLMIVVLVANGMVERMFVQTATGYDLIVGPKGSQLELVLTSIYRIGVAGEPAALPVLPRIDLREEQPDRPGGANHHG